MHKQCEFLQGDRDCMASLMSDASCVLAERHLCTGGTGWEVCGFRVGSDSMGIWVWVNTYRYIFSGLNIHLPAILGFTRYQGFDPSPFQDPKMEVPSIYKAYIRPM
jgi:hypothetical protein